MARLFGWEFTISKEAEKENDELKSITPSQNDGSMVVDVSSTSEGMIGDAVAYSMSFDTDPEVISEHALITKYREISLIPEVDFAIDDIVNAFVSSDDNNPVKLDLDELDYSQNLKKKIIEEFDYILSLLDFNANAYNIVKRWYVDGRLPYQVIVNETNYKTDGIGKLTYIDPRLLRKVRVVKRDKDLRTGVDVYTDKNEYYVFSETGFGTSLNSVTTYADQGVRLSKESIVYATSGILNPSNTIVLSHLHKALRAINQLKSLEDAAIIYRLSRAPERRVFYIDVGNLPPAKAEQVLHRQMQQYKSKVVYDSTSGAVRGDPKHMTMIEDYWLPRRGDSKATEISNLPGGQNLGEMEEVNYFLTKLYKALNVPVSRLDAQSGFNFGRVTEINRDEVKFNKFIERIRKEFSKLFLELLKRQLALKNILHPDEFDRVKNFISFEYASDNIFNESMDNEIMTGRLDLLGRLGVSEIVGEYVSKEWIRRNIFRFSQEEIDQLDEQIAQEMKDGEYNSEIDAAAEEKANAMQPPQPSAMQLQVVPSQQPAPKQTEKNENPNERQKDRSTRSSKNLVKPSNQ